MWEETRREGCLLLRGREGRRGEVEKGGKGMGRGEEEKGEKGVTMVPSTSSFRGLL